MINYRQKKRFLDLHTNNLNIDSNTKIKDVRKDRDCFVAYIAKRVNGSPDIIVAQHYEYEGRYVYGSVKVSLEEKIITDHSKFYLFEADLYDSAMDTVVSPRTHLITKEDIIKNIHDILTETVGCKPYFTLEKYSKFRLLIWRFGDKVLVINYDDAMSSNDLILEIIIFEAQTSKEIEEQLARHFR